MIYTLPESQDAKLSNSAYGIVFGSVFMEIWTNLSTLQHHCNIFFAHCNPRWRNLLVLDEILEPLNLDVFRTSILLPLWLYIHGALSHWQLVNIRESICGYINFESYSYREDVGTISLPNIHLTTLCHDMNSCKIYRIY